MTPDLTPDPDLTDWPELRVGEVPDFAQASVDAAIADTPSSHPDSAKLNPAPHAHTATLSEPPPYEVIDLDNPFIFGVGRRASTEERKEAILHGVTEDRPMSVLGITHEGIAGVMGKDVATLFAASPALFAEMVRYLPILQRLEERPDLWAELTAGTGIATTNGYKAALTQATAKP